MTDPVSEKLYNAIRTADTETIRNLLATYKINHDRAYRDGLPALHYAYLNSRNPILIGRLLLDQGANPDRRDQARRVPLHYAAERADLDFIELLLERGVQLDIQDRYGRTPLHYAMEHPDIAKLLLLAGADPNVQDLEGRTPLHWMAIYSGLYSFQDLDEVMDLFRRKNARLELQDREGRVFVDLIVDPIRRARVTQAPGRRGTSPLRPVSFMPLRESESPSRSPAGSFGSPSRSPSGSARSGESTLSESLFELENLGLDDSPERQASPVRVSPARFESSLGGRRSRSPNATSRLVRKR